MNDRVRSVYARMAEGYDRSMRLQDRLWDIPSGRAWACGELSGHVLEQGIGTGLNLPFYPEGTHLTGVDLSPAMLERARERANVLGRRVGLLEGDVTALPFPDASFDAVASTLTLCTIPDPVAAVREALRVCRPGGRLRFFEHGRSRYRLVVWVEALLEPLMLRLEADRLLLEPDQVLQEAGAEIVGVQRQRLGIFWRVEARRRA